MKKYIFLFTVFFTFLSSVTWSQFVESPLYSNPALAKKHKPVMQTKAAGDLDSTFIYIMDTVDLPFFDEFSTNKFQTFNADYSDPGVTSEIFYRLLDPGTDAPLDTSVRYTSIQTFKRTVDLAGAVYVDEPFAPTPIKVGDLSQYPVVYNTVNGYPPYYIYDTIDFPNDPDTIYLTGPEYFQDSIRIFSAPVNNPELLWADDYVYHNYTFADKPWSLGIATFDGLDEDGRPYEPGSTSSGYADRLTSKPINMAGYSDVDSVYLSFLVQPGGLGEEPEPDDFMELEFYAPDLLEWTTVWTMIGGANTDFQVGHIRISDPKYFKDGFQFRFKNYGMLSGALDHFHLDYVNLRIQSGYQDTLFKDFAFSYPLNTLLKDYTSVPWDHYKASPAGRMSDAVQISVRNGSNLPENNQNGLSTISYQGSTEGSVTLLAQTLSGGAINYAPRTYYESYHDFASSYQFDPSKPGPKAFFDVLTTASAQFPNLTLNDSTTFTQAFLNYYAHDDGTAERAIGPSGAQAMLAVQYESYIPDSLIAVDIQFVQSAIDVSNKLFILTVWNDNNNEPGNIIYEDDNFFPRQPSYYPTDGDFKRYYLLNNEVLSLPQKFYVGYRQIEGSTLNVGNDKNIDTKEKTFASFNGGVLWEQNSIKGSIMIRPVFSTSLNAELGIEVQEKPQANIRVFPNPATDKININCENFDFQGMVLLNLQGQVIKETSTLQFDLSDLPDGIYLIRLNNYAGNTLKVIKN